MNALEAGTNFLNDVLSKLPEAQRAQAAAAFADAAAAQAALTALGEGALRHADYSRQADAARAAEQRATELYNQNRAWFEQNQADLKTLPQLIEENTRLKAQTPGEPRQTGDPAQPPTKGGPSDGYVKVEDLQGVIAESLGLHAVVPTLLASHFQRFGEWLNRDQLVSLFQNAQQGHRTVEAQYALTFGERLAAKAAEEKAAEIARIKAEGVAEFRAANPNLPYPVRSTAQEVSPLDALKSNTPFNQAEATPEALAAAYNALVAQRVPA